MIAKLSFSYAGIVDDDKHALSCLGGINTISKVIDMPGLSCSVVDMLLCCCWRLRSVAATNY